MAVSIQNIQIKDNKTEENRIRSVQNTKNLKKRKASETEEEKEKRLSAQRNAVQRFRKRQKEMKLQGSPAKVKSRSPVAKKVPVVNITLPLSTVTAAVSQACADQKQDVELPISLTTHIIEQVKKATSKSTSFTHASSTTKKKKDECNITSNHSPKSQQSDEQPPLFTPDSSDSTPIPRELVLKEKSKSPQHKKRTTKK